MANVNLSGTAQGKSFETVLVDDDVYDAKVVEVVDKPVKTDSGTYGPKTRYIIRFGVMTRDGEKVIPHFCTNTISKGSGSYQSSKLYVLLEKAGLIEKFRGFVGMEDGEADDESVIGFLKQELVGLKARVLTKAIDGSDDQHYSIVDKVMNFNQGGGLVGAEPQKTNSWASQKQGG